MNDYITETHPALADFDIEGQEAAEAAAAANPPADPADPPPAEPPAPEAPAEPDPEDAATPPTETAQEKQDRLWAGKYKTPEEMEKAIPELQSLHDKQLAAMQSSQKKQQEQIDQWNEYYRQQEAYQSQQAEIGSITPEQWAQSIDMAPVDTLNWAAENYPEAVPHIISRVRETKGNQMADSMMVSYQQDQLARQQYQQQQVFAQQQQKAASDPRTNIELAMEAVTERYGDEFTQMQEDVSATIQSGNYNIDFGNAANIAGAVEHAFLAAYRGRTMKQNALSTSQPQLVSPQTETGNPGQAPAADEADSIADEIVGQWQNNPYSR